MVICNYLSMPVQVKRELGNLVSVPNSAVVEERDAGVWRGTAR